MEKPWFITVLDEWVARTGWPTMEEDWKTAFHQYDVWKKSPQVPLIDGYRCTETLMDMILAELLKQHSYESATVITCILIMPVTVRGRTEGFMRRISVM